MGMRVADEKRGGSATLECKLVIFKSFKKDIEHDFVSRYLGLNPFADDAPSLNDEELPFVETRSLFPFSFVLALSFQDRCNLVGI